MSRSFFRVLKLIEKDLPSKVEQLSEEEYNFVRISFYKLTNCIRQCNFSNAPVQKFICKNYELGRNSLADLWNSCNKKKKTASSFAGQDGDISNQLYAIFDCNENTLYEAFTQPVVSDINSFMSTVNALSIEGRDLTKETCYDIVSFLDGQIKSDKTYDVKDCKYELELLKTISSANMDSLFDKADKDKLRFLVSALKQPITYFGTVEKTKKTGETYTTTEPMVNIDKIEIYKHFYDAEALVLMRDGKTVEHIITKEVPIPVPVEENIPYNINITKDMVHAIQNKISGGAKEGDMEASSKEGVERIKKYLSIFTDESFNSQINKFNYYDFVTALESFKKK